MLDGETKGDILYELQILTGLGLGGSGDISTTGLITSEAVAYSIMPDVCASVFLREELCMCGSRGKT